MSGIKKGDIWRTIKYLSNDFYDNTELVKIIEVLKVGNENIIRYRAVINMPTHIVLCLITGGFWLLMHFGDSNLMEKRETKFLSTSTKVG